MSLRLFEIYSIASSDLAECGLQIGVNSALLPTLVAMR